MTHCAKVHLRVTKTEGGVSVFTLIVNGQPMADLTPVEIIEAVMNFTSALRFWNK